MLRETWTDAKVIGFFGTILLAVYMVTHPPQTWQFILEIVRIIKGG